MPGYEPSGDKKEERELRRMELDRLVRLLPYYKGYTRCPKCKFPSMTTKLVQARNYHGQLVERYPGDYGFNVLVMLRKCPNCGGSVLQKPLDYPGVTL